jgi:hypothetical protein
MLSIPFSSTIGKANESMQALADQGIEQINVHAIANATQDFDEFQMECNRLSNEIYFQQQEVANGALNEVTQYAGGVTFADANNYFLGTVSYGEPLSCFEQNIINLIWSSAIGRVNDRCVEVVNARI